MRDGGIALHRLGIGGLRAGTYVFCSLSCQAKFECAGLLGDEMERNTSWSLEQWAQFRTRIRDKLAEWRVKHGGGPLPGDGFR